MARNVRCGLIQASNVIPGDRPVAEVKQAMLDKHVKLVEEAAAKGLFLLS